MKNPMAIQEFPSTPTGVERQFLRLLNKDDLPQFKRLVEYVQREKINMAPCEGLYHDLPTYKTVDFLAQLEQIQPPPEKYLLETVWNAAYRNTDAPLMHWMVRALQTHHTISPTHREKIEELALTLVVVKSQTANVSKYAIKDCVQALLPHLSSACCAQLCLQALANEQVACAGMVFKNASTEDLKISAQKYRQTLTDEDQQWLDTKFARRQNALLNEEINALAPAASKQKVM